MTNTSAPPSPHPVVATAITPTLGALAKKSVFWVVAATFALVIALIALLLTNAAASGGAALGRDNPKPGGAMALAEVLSDQGVNVRTADSLEFARDAVEAAQANGESVSLLVYDADSLLTSSHREQLAQFAPTTVIIDPDFAMLQQFAPEIGFGGVSGTEQALTAGDDCTSAAAERAGMIAGLNGGQLKTLSVPRDATGYSVCFSAAGDAASDSRQSVLVQNGQFSFVADPALFANESITEAGNAALALGLLGENPTLVWYLPTLADLADSAPPSLAELSPGWVPPVMMLLVVCGIAAAIAYGRRFGPLVVENLPVTVRASETMEGRARLYARNSARLRALDSLRIATISRLAAQLGLARTASVPDVVAATASVTMQNPSVLRALLVDATPRNDAELVALSEQLLELERSVEHRIRPGNAPRSSPSHPSNERMES